MADPITLYGLSPVPSSPTTLLSSPPANQPPPYIPISSLPIPGTPLSERINTYALANLPTPTYNHSRRVYHYGLAIRDYRFSSFPEWGFSEETFFCACLLHDIGTTTGCLESTRLSFEFAGGFLALRVLQDAHGDGDGIAPQDQAESITEAIIRHQDLCSKGNITALGQLIQMATLLDNTGAHEALIHPSTIEDVSKHFPRMKWSTCFADTIRKENSLKPWAHSTTLGEDEFRAKVLGNSLMAPYE